MKIALLFSLLLTTSSFSLPASRCSSQDEAAFRTIATQWKQAYNDGDPAGVARLYADDATYLTQHYAKGIVQGKPLIEAYVKNGTDTHYHIESIDVISTDCSGDLGYVIDKYVANNGGQQAFGVNLIVLRRTSDKWLIVAHEAAVPDPANSIQRLEPVESAKH